MLLMNRFSVKANTASQQHAVSMNDEDLTKFTIHLLVALYPSCQHVGGYFILLDQLVVTDRMNKEKTDAEGLSWVVGLMFGGALQRAGAAPTLTYISFETISIRVSQ